MTPIVFLHGFLGSSKDWQPLISALPTNFDVMTLSLPGHDETPVLPEPNLNRIAAFACEKFVGMKVHLVGYSLGGRIALKICELIPNQIQSLTLISAAPGLKIESEIDDRKKTDLIWVEKIEKDFKSFLVEWYQQPLFTDLSEMERKNLVERRLKNNPQDLKQVFIGTSQAHNPHSWRIIEELKCPSLFVTGEYDQKYQKIGSEIQAINSLFKLEVVPAAGHLPQITQPNKTSQIIKTFLEDLEKRN